jgi:hypothetical protein
MEKIVRRYAAYFPRWCQAFGDHRTGSGSEKGRAVEWLVGEGCVGVIVLPEDRRYRLMHELLGDHRIRKSSFISARCTPQPSRLRRRSRLLAIPAMRRLHQLLLDSEEETHMFLAYHLIYPPGTRIITVSLKPPLRAALQGNGPTGG